MLARELEGAASSAPIIVRDKCTENRLGVSVMQAPEHRRRSHPIHQPVHRIAGRPTIIFLTVCSQGKKSILAEQEKFELIVAMWPDAKTWLVGKFVVMPDHIHLFCAPATSPAEPLKQWVKYWKALISLSWPRPKEQPIWQREFWDTQLRRAQSYESKWNYVVQNPVRAGLVTCAEDWPFQGELNIL